MRKPTTQSRRDHRADVAHIRALAKLNARPAIAAKRVIELAHTLNVAHDARAKY